MLIVGIDGAEYSLSRDFGVEKLVNDLGTLHTIPSWTEMFTVSDAPRERPGNYHEPIADDFIWDADDQTFTLANVPVTYPTTDRNCSVPEQLGLPHGNGERQEERRVLEGIYRRAGTDHTILVLGGLDTFQHRNYDRDALTDAYSRAFNWALNLGPDVLLSDHGFETFGGKGGVNDHGPDGIVRGLDAEKVSEVSSALIEKLKIDV